ncbi:MAG: glyceraldehyde 3-phosphate dehydrogenase, glyceraldehyde 3-phosphate dehydrogenase [Candidatus Parcubacteria bacterium]
MAVRVAINGFGRIGRAFVRAGMKEGGIEFVAINDLGELDNLAYLLKYDSVYGRADFEVRAEGDTLIVGNQKVKKLAEKEPAKLPWKDLGVDVVVECTGFFTEFAKAKAHIDAGARKVVISAPAKGKPEEVGVPSAMVLLGVNDEKLKDMVITSNASCTTNASSPLIVALDEAIGIEKAILNTTHAYTATQAIVDGSAKDDWRRGRAGALNMSPSSTGAAKAVSQVYEPLKGKFDGIAVRVPVPAGSLADVTFISKRPTTVEEVNDVLKKAAANPRWQRVFAVSEEQLVSSDIVGSAYGSIADLTMTRVVDGNLVKVLAWYDNEMGYTYTLVRHVLETGQAVA